MSTDRQLVFAAVADERRQIANLLDGLSDAQLRTPSLCEGWDVKTVAAHLVSVVADGFWEFQRMAFRHRSMHRGIDQLAKRRAQLSAPEIAAALRKYADCELSPPVTGPLSGLADVLIHSADIRIPLRMPFGPCPERVALALDFLTGLRPFGFVPRGRLRGICLRGTDIGRMWGRGAEIRGPAAALMISACGRTALLDTLDGPGVPLLRDRLSD